jgi:hypothetical protein
VKKLMPIGSAILVQVTGGCPSAASSRSSWSTKKFAYLK